MRDGIEPPDDQTLARQVQGGSISAFEELVYRYEARVYRFVFNCGCGQADAEEVTQDTFVRAFQAIDRFDPRRSFATWLFTIARRRSVDRHRATRGEAGPLPETPRPQDPSEILAQREADQEVWALARRCLPDVQFQALWLRYAEDLGVPEVASVLGRTRTHVKVLLFRARHRLAQELGKAGAKSADRSELSKGEARRAGTRDSQNSDLSLVGKH